MSKNNSLVTNPKFVERIKDNESFDNPLYMFNSHCIWVTNNIKDYLLGQVLTIIDSAISNEKQNKATKDLVKNTVWSNEYYSGEFADIIRQYIDKYQPEMKKYFSDLPSGDHPQRTFFK